VYARPGQDTTSPGDAGFGAVIGATPSGAPKTFGQRVAALLQRDFLVGGITPTYYFTRWIFLRLLGIVHLIAFTSFWWQMKGLIGSNGIAPATLFLQGVIARAEHWEHPWTRVFVAPTLCWISSGDWFLHLLCAVGVLAATVLIADIAPAVCLAILYACYLSLASVTPDFLEKFNWDTLLLEATFLSIFFAPAKLWPGVQREEVHSRIMLMLLRWMLFRLMFMSGYAKLWNDTWWNLDAMKFHYETQPLPHMLSWYAHHLPGWIHAISVVCTLTIECVLPFLLLAPRRIRAGVCAVFILFQISIGMTGNYTFFNLLVIAACLLLLDDRHWHYLAPARWKLSLKRPPLRRLWLPRKLAMGALACVLVVISGLQMCLILGLNIPIDSIPAFQFADHYHVANRYGLFARMTTTRPELVIEGSADGQQWRAYEFKWKPGDLDRRPGWVQPFQPRLDWEMWFAASQEFPPAWFRNFCYRILEGQPEVLTLLDENPFAGTPPRYVRAIRFDYRFSTPAERASSGAWWVREPLGVFMPPMTLRGRE